MSPIAITDPKGDRSLRPHEQADPDLYVRVVKKTADGVIVRGAKHPIGSSPIMDEIIVAPTRHLTKEEGDWAIAFAIPADTEGLKIITLPAQQWRPRIELKAPYAEYGRTSAFLVFDDVFVPWERVFLCGETEWGSEVGRLTSMYHRYLYSACKPGQADIFLGMAALLAEYNGIEKASHVKEKLANFIATSELVYAAGIAAGVRAKEAPSGTVIPDETFLNVARHHAGVNAYHEFEMVADIAGALGATLPHEADFINPETGPFLNKYIARKAEVSCEDVHRLWRYVNDMLGGPQVGEAMVGALHAGGSPIMENIALLRLGNIEEKKRIVKRLAGIKY